MLVAYTAEGKWKGRQMLGRERRSGPSIAKRLHLPNSQPKTHKQNPLKALLMVPTFSVPFRPMERMGKYCTREKWMAENTEKQTPKKPY
jgi:hypothetical protein